MHSIAVYLVQRCFGGPEEGGWWFDAGARAVEPDLVTLGETVIGNNDASLAAKRIQAILDRDWNIGDHARPIDSVLSARRYEAHWFEGWPPSHFPEQRPRYE